MQLVAAVRLQGHSLHFDLLFTLPLTSQNAAFHNYKNVRNAGCLCYALSIDAAEGRLVCANINEQKTHKKCESHNQAVETVVGLFSSHCLSLIHSAALLT
jgi:hypothetical protein